MRTETKANDVTIRRHEVDDLPKTAKNLDGFVMRIKAIRKRQTTKQHAYDFTDPGASPWDCLTRPKAIVR